MFWIIAAVIAALVMLILMSKRTETEEDPVCQTVLEVDRLADEITRWETNLWSLWAMAVVETLLYRLDMSARTLYLNKLEDQILELQRDHWENNPMSEKDPIFPYFDEKTTDLHTP